MKQAKLSNQSIGRHEPANHRLHYLRKDEFVISSWLLGRYRLFFWN